MQREPKKTESLEVRLPPETKSAFMAACRSNGTSASRVLRGFIAQYLAASQRAPRSRQELAMVFTGSRRRRIASFTLGTAAAAAAAAATFAVPAHANVDARIAAVFEWMDGDRDGRVDAPEFQRSLETAPPLGAVALIVDSRTPPPAGETRAALFRRLDGNRDGALALDELAAAATVRTAVSPGAAEADANRDGSLTEGELAAYLTAQRAAAGLADPAAGAGLMARGIVGEHDRDGDGKVALADLAR